MGRSPLPEREGASHVALLQGGPEAHLKHYEWMAEAKINAYGYESTCKRSLIVSSWLLLACQVKSAKEGNYKAYVTILHVTNGRTFELQGCTGCTL